MRVIWKKVWRDIWNHKSRTAMVVISIAIGVFAIGLTLGILENVQQRMSSAWRASNPSHIVIGVGDGTRDTTVHFIGAMQGIEGAEAVTAFGTRWKADPDDTAWESVTITSRTDYDAQQYDRLTLLDGAWPIRGTVAVDRGSARRWNIGIGDTVYIEVSGRPRPMQVVGIVYDAVAVPPVFTNDASFYVTRRDLERLGGPSNFTQLKAAISDYDEERAKTAALEIEDRLDELDISHGAFLLQDPQNHFFQEILDGLILILVVMSFLALGLSLLLVVNTITSIITEQVPQIGIMKAVGATSGRIFIIYLTGVLTYELIALSVAIPLAVLLSSLASSAGLELFNVDPGDFFVSRNALLAQFGLGLFAPMLAAMRPIITGSQISVREAISTYGIGEQMGLIARGLTQLRMLPRLVMLTIANTFRRKMRLTLTQISLIGGGAIFIMVMSVQSSLLGSFEQVRNTYNFDIIMAFDRPHHIPSIKAEVESFPNVDYVEVLDFLVETPLRRVDDVDERDVQSITLIAMARGGEGYLPPITEGRWLVPEDRGAIVLNDHLADELGLSVGDDVIMEIKGEDTTWNIVGLQFDLNDDQTASAVWLEDFGKETGTSGMGSFLFIVALPQDQDELMSLTDDLTERLEERGRNVIFALTSEEWTTLQVSTAMVIVYLLMFVGVLIAIVGSVGLSGTLSINALERRREIGMMRAVGASGRAIAGLFIGEGIIIGLMSWLIALPVSVPLGWVFANILGDTIQLKLIYEYSLLGVLIWLVLVLVFSVLASGLPAWRAMKVSVREVLSYE